MKPHLFLFLTLFLVSLLVPKPASAEEEFSTSYFVNYDLTKPDDNVDFQVTVVNLTNKAYIREYTLNIAAGNPQNIKATDKNGALAPWVENTAGTTKIKTTFNDKIVGKGAYRDWHIFYTDESVGKKNGLVWNINVPKFKDVPTLTSYAVKLTIPESFGPEIYSSPIAKKIERVDDRRTYYYEGEALKNSGALLSFGNYQLYEFKLKYHLKNPNLFPSEVKITLPPDIRGEQEIYISKVDPAPAKVQEDPDGNYSAVYRLTGNREKIVEVEGLARVTHPKRNFTASGMISDIPKNLIDSYTRNQPYWETDDPQVTEIIKQVNRSGTTVSQTALALFNYTSENLKYNKDRINKNLTRYGAKKALQNKNDAVCMEFADVLTTLLRAAGIPAQVLEGYAFTEDEKSRPVIGDVLHSWVRFYDPRFGWISVDPTWASTSGLDYFSRLDTNHLVFAIKGTSSVSPYPAGAYKISPSQTGDIKVGLKKENIQFPKENIEMGLTVDTNFFTNLLSPKLNLLIINKGGTAIFDGRVNFSSNKADVSPKGLKIGNLPPYGEKKIALDLRSSMFKTFGDISLTVNLGYTNFDGEFKNRKWEKNTYIASNLTFLILTPGILLVIGLWGYFFLKDQQSFLRK